MVCILRIDCKKYLLFIVIAILTSCLFIISASASVRLFTSAIDPNDLTDGIYNIVNRETGQYLDVYSLANDTAGRLYLSKKTGKSGQNFLVERQDDGTYIIYPQNEDGIYSLSYDFDIMESEFISKKANVTNQSKFSILPIIEDKAQTGYYSIKPTCMNDNMLSLGISQSVGKFKYTLAGLALENDSFSQQWQFVKVSSESLNILGGYVNVKMGSTHHVIAKLTPAYLIGNMIWESSNPEVATVDSRGMVYGVSEGTATITVTCGNQTDSTIVKVTDLPAFTWYSQHNAFTGGWAGENLDKVFMTNYAGEKKAFFVSGYQTGDDWMEKGCKLCSESMVLHNLGAKLTIGYDLRTDTTNNLDADPFTVALANSGATGLNLDKTRVINDPNYINNRLINARFTVDGKTIVTQHFNGNNLKHIKTLLDSHPEGVIVGMNNPSRNTTHYVVFTECLNPDDPKGNYEFRICDSAASLPELGDNVPFKESISYKSLGYGYWSIFDYAVYNIIE